MKITALTAASGDKMRIPALVLLGVVGFALSACGRGDVEPEDRIANQAAYEQVLSAMPDSVLTALPPLDTLFLNYDGVAFGFTPPDSGAVAAAVDSVLAALTLEEKIGQLFIVHLEEPGLFRAVSRTAREAVERFHVGGFLVSRNAAPEFIYEQSQAVQRMSRVPLFIAADFERGVGRFDNAFTELPSNMAIGATGDTLFAAAAGRLTALESRAVGVNLLFAPVVDVNNNPDNPIINIRSYGEDAEMVSRMAAAYVREAQTHGVLATLKHYPGHGNTSVDTHARMAVVGGSREDLNRVELLPYRRLLAGSSPPAAVMSAHLWVKAFDRRPTPATLSTFALTDLLRNELGFQGLIITDDIRMGGVSNDYTAEERIVGALQAGVDIILTPDDLNTARQAVRKALQTGSISEADLDASVRLILSAKGRIGLFRERTTPPERMEFLMESPRGAYLAQAIADRSVTLWKGELASFPASGARVVLVQLANYQDSEGIEAAQDYFQSLMDGYDLTVRRRFDRDPAAEAVRNIVEKAGDSDWILIALYQRLQAGRGEAGLLPRQAELVRRLIDLELPVALITFGNPYAVSRFGDADIVLVAYDQTTETVRAAARLLRSEQPARGKLPVTVERTDPSKR